MSRAASSPRVSVVAYVYDYADWVGAMLRSVLGQSHRDFELFFLDDGSTDATPDVVARFAADPRLRYERQDNRGRDRLHETFNRCLEATTGELVAIVNGDDIWAPHKLARQVALLDARPDIDVCIHDAVFIDGEGRERPGSFDPGLPAHVLETGRLGPWMFERNPVPNPAVVFRRSLLDRIGLQEYGWPHDYQFWMKAAVAGAGFLFLPEKLIRYRVHEGSHSTSAERLPRLTEECRRMRREMRARYSIEDLFPEVEHCRDRTRARAIAHVEMALRLASGADPLIDLAQSELRAAHAFDPSVVASGRAEDLVRLTGDPREELVALRSGPRIPRRRACAAVAEPAPSGIVSTARESSPAPILRVLFVLHSYSRDWRGGTEVYARALALALRAQGVEVAIFHPEQSTGIAAPRLEESSEDGLRILRLLVDARLDLTRQIEEPTTESLFRDVLARERFDVVHFQHTWHALPFRLLPLAKETGSTVCLTLHDFWFLCYQTHLYPERDRALCSGPESAEKCARCLFRNAGIDAERDRIEAATGFMQARAGAARTALDACDVVTGPSRYLVDKYASFGFRPGRIELAPLGLEPVDRPAITRDPRLTFGFLGAFAPLKDPEILVRAFRRVRGDARLLLFGKGTKDGNESVERAIAGDPRIGWPGPYAPRDLGRVLAQLDVVVMPSRVENYPLVAREALAAGVPVIASRVGGLPEIVEDDRNGLLFEPGNEDDLAQLLQHLVDHPEELERLRRGIRPVKDMQTDAREWLARYRAHLRAQPSRSRARQTADSFAAPLAHAPAAEVRSDTGPWRGCSIVIPTWNGLGMLRDCLEAIRANTPIGDVDTGEWEVVVVDNGSADGTLEHLRGLTPPFRFVRSDENLGFARGCNLGARAARGDLLLFLNNDTLPQPGWLAPLVRELRSDPGAGIAGAKLLYPNGRIQHAGIAFSRDSRIPYHVYPGFDSHWPAANHRRELRAVTGACLLVRRDAFEAAGGFDEGYRNGLEDIDLCLSVRARGGRIVYQPASVVVHLEEQTPGRKDHDGANLARFFARWGERIFPDEAWVLFEDGFFARGELRNGVPVRAMYRIADEPMRARWARVTETERRLWSEGLDAARDSLRDPAAWPDEPELRAWAASLCDRLGDPALAARWRGEAASVEAPREPTSPRDPAPSPSSPPASAPWMRRAIESLHSEILR